MSTHWRRWTNWANEHPHRRILRAILTIGGVGMVANVALVVRELVVAYWFGTSDANDAYVVAYLLPLLTMHVVAGSFA